MTSKKPYYPNNWKKYKDAPDEVYDSINDAHTHDLMHIVYIYLDYFNEYGGHYD